MFPAIILLTKTVYMKRLFIILLLVVVSHSLFAQNLPTPAKVEKKYTIENCVTVFSMDKVIKTDVGYQFWFADKDFIDGRTLKMSVVAPHSATHAPHKHVEDEFFFVLEGTAEFFLDGKTKTAGPYTSFYCPSNVEHGIKNPGDTQLKYLVIKKYQE